MARGCIFSLLVHLIYIKHTAIFLHHNTQVHKPRTWNMAGAAFQQSGQSFCHTAHQGEDVSTTNNTTVMSPRHPYQETFSRSSKGNKTVQRPGDSWPPCGWWTTFAGSSAALVVTLCVGETYKLPTSPSQGQGWWVWQERGSYSLDLR